MKLMKWLAVALCLVLGLANSSAAQASPDSAPTGEGSDCVTNVVTGGVRCFTDFRTAMSAATGGRVNDAPLSSAVARTDKKFAADINASNTNASGQAAGSQRAAGPAAAAASFVISIVYADYDLSGPSMTYTAASDCSSSARVSALTLGSFNNRISSFKTFGNCGIRYYQDESLGGASSDWYAADSANVSADMNDQISSIQWMFAPTRVQLLKDCNDSTKCQFIPEGTLTKNRVGYREVGRMFNCSPLVQRRILTWTQTQGATYTFSNELSVTAGWAFLSKFEAGVKSRFDVSWAWSQSYSDASWLDAPANGWIALDMNPEVQTSAGYYDMWYSKKRWDHYNWFILDFTSTAPIPGATPQTRVRGGVMTDAEYAQNCGTRAAVAAKAAGAGVVYSSANGVADVSKDGAVFNAPVTPTVTPVDEITQTLPFSSSVSH